MRLVTVLLIIGVAIFSGCIEKSSSESCVSDANAMSESSRQEYVKGDLQRAARLQSLASFDLEQCLKRHPKQISLSTRTRLAQVWRIAGQLQGDSLNIRAARASLNHAKRIVSKLRLEKSLRGTLLNEVLLENREVNDELARIAKRSRSNHGAANQQNRD